MKKKLLISALLIMSLSLVGCVKETAPTAQNHPQEIEVETRQIEEASPTRTYQAPLPIIDQYRTVQGPLLAIGQRKTGFTFPQYQGKVILLQIFGKECHFCFAEMPIVNNLRRKYAQNLQVVALQANEQMSKRKSSNLIERFQMHYPIIDRDQARNLLLFIQKTYGWTGVLPYTLLIKNGVTEFSYKGEISPQEIEGDLRSLL